MPPVPAFAPEGAVDRVAAEAFAAAAMPSVDEEVWRYSRIGELDLSRYAPLDGTTADPAVPSTAGDPGYPYGARVVVVDGVVVSIDVSAALDEAGVFVGRLVDHPDAEALLGSVMTEAVDVFTELNTAFSTDAIAIVVPAGMQVELPVLVEHHTIRPGAAVFPRLVVHAGADSSVTVVDEQRSADQATLVVPVVELRADRAARLSYCNVQQLGLASWQLGAQVADVGADATLIASNASLGGDYARARTDCRLVGNGASGELVSLYFGNEKQTLDFRTFQEHAAPHTTSNLLFKGVVDDHAQSVYTGLIKVRKNAHGTNAFQTNRNLKLSADARAESVPNLEIENNDVRCSHASTVGPIDEDQRFYLESRGVPPVAAERLVVAGFFAEVLEKVPVAGVIPALRAAIAAKLDAHLDAVSGSTSDEV
jgi:Fe-S cluster assembly protein SufD